MQFATALTENNVSHTGEYNSNLLRGTYLSRYDIDLDKEAAYMTSDTASAATAVSTYFEITEQVNCEMHVVNLALQYGIGVSENTKKVLVTLANGKKEKVTVIVTPGGELKDGEHVHRTLRKLSKFLNHSQ